jgi:hypothetical protein
VKRRAPEHRNSRRTHTLLRLALPSLARCLGRAGRVVSTPRYPTRGVPPAAVSRSTYERGYDRYARTGVLDGKVRQGSRLGLRDHKAIQRDMELEPAGLFFDLAAMQSRCGVQVGHPP